MKNLMTLDRLDAETALELPNREMLLVTIIVSNVDVSIPITIKNNNVAVQVCAAIDLLGPLFIAPVECDIVQK